METLELWLAPFYSSLRLELYTPEGEEIFLLGFRIGDSLQNASEGVGEEEGKDELHCDRRLSVSVARRAYGWTRHTLIRSGANLVAEVDKDCTRCQPMRLRMGRDWQAVRVFMNGIIVSRVVAPRGNVYVW